MNIQAAALEQQEGNMPRNPLNPRKSLVWTPEDDKTLLQHFEKLGPRKLSESGLLPGKNYNAIRKHYRHLLGIARQQRDGSTRPLRPVPQFERQHTSVWGYAAAVGSAA